MKKVYLAFAAILAVSAILLSGCKKELVLENANKDVTEIVLGDYNLSVSESVPFKTKAAEFSDMKFMTVSENSANKPLVIGQRQLDDTSNQLVVFEPDGTELARLIAVDDELIEINSLAGEFIDANYSNGSHTNGERLPGEKYGACVKRVFHKYLDINEEIMKDTGLLDYYAREVFGPGLCAYIAIVGCSQ